MNDVAPYKAVLTHGFTVDADGKKMSKSKGNVIAPQTIMKTLGADVLRLWVAATDYRGEMNVSEEILKRSSDMYRRLRNTARFLLSNLDGFDPERNLVSANDMLALDRWVVDRAYGIQQEVITAYDSYQFHLICQKVHHFCAIDLGRFYLDIIKDRQYTTQEDSLARRSAQSAMYHVVEALARWLAPITSYTADEIWQFLPGEHNESIFLQTWYEDLLQLDEDAPFNREFWEKIIQIRDAVSRELEQVRGKGLIGGSLEAEVELYCNDEYAGLLNKLGSELHFVLLTSAASVMDMKFCPDDALVTELDGVKLKVIASEHSKCVRCWHYRHDVGENTDHPELCGRCVENIAGEGENRQYA